MKAVKFFVITIALSLLFAACGGKNAKNQITLEEAKAGRDQELFRDGVHAIRKGRYDEGRVLLNTMINTYPESPMLRVAKIAIADSFYIEGSSKSMAQAEVEYREVIQFFPDDPLADDMMMKMAEIHLRQVQAPDRDTTHAKLAERQLKELLRRYPNTDQKEQINSLMNQVQEILATHELIVAKFYYNRREAAPAAQMRTEEILNKYPNFSRMDEALWLHAQAMADQEDTETASQDLTRIVTNYPNSEYSARAKELLTKWGKPVPEPDPAKLAEPMPEGKGFAGRLLSVVLGPKIDTSPKGVIIDRDRTTDELVDRAREISGAPKLAGPVAPDATTTTNDPDARPRRATTQATQDVEVKAGSPTEQKEQPASGKDDKKKQEKDKKKKNDSSSKLLRNP